jgi:hypothetical protein
MKRAAPLALLIALALPAAAQARPLGAGTYQTTTREVSCDWDPASDFAACANRHLWRRGRSMTLDSLNGPSMQKGEVIRGGRRLRRGTTLDAGSVVCKFRKRSVRCANDSGGFIVTPHGFEAWL